MIYIFLPLSPNGNTILSAVYFYHNFLTPTSSHKQLWLGNGSTRHSFPTFFQGSRKLCWKIPVHEQISWGVVTWCELLVEWWWLMDYQQSMVDIFSWSVNHWWISNQEKWVNDGWLMANSWSVTGSWMVDCTGWWYDNQCCHRGWEQIPWWHWLASSSWSPYGHRSCGLKWWSKWWKSLWWDLLCRVAWYFPSLCTKHLDGFSHLVTNQSTHRSKRYPWVFSSQEMTMQRPSTC